MAYVDPAITPSTTLVTGRIGAFAGQWSAVLAGVLAGFGVTIILATLGAALGLTAIPTDSTVTNIDAEEVAGAGIAWSLLTALAVGSIGGIVLARMAHPSLAFPACTLGMATWTGGVALALMVAAPAASVMTGALASGAAATAATQTFEGRPISDRVLPGNERNGAPVEASMRGNLSEADRARLQAAATDAAEAAKVTAWTALLAQIVSLAATVFAAKLVHKRIATTVVPGQVLAVP